MPRYLKFILIVVILLGWAVGFFVFAAFMDTAPALIHSLKAYFSLLAIVTTVVWLLPTTHKSSDRRNK